MVGGGVLFIATVYSPAWSKCLMKQKHSGTGCQLFVKENLCFCQVFFSICLCSPPYCPTLSCMRSRQGHHPSSMSLVGQCKMNLSFKKADWSLFTYFIAQLCLQLKIFSSFSAWDDESQALRKCSHLWGGGADWSWLLWLLLCCDLTVTSSDVFLLPLCPANISILPGVCIVSQEQAFLCTERGVHVFES